MLLYTNFMYRNVDRNCINIKCYFGIKYRELFNNLIQYTKTNGWEKIQKILKRRLQSLSNTTIAIDSESIKRYNNIVNNESAVLLSS